MSREVITLLLAFGVQIPSIWPMAQRFTAVWVNHETRIPVHCAANVTRGGIFYYHQQTPNPRECVCR